MILPVIRTAGAYKPIVPAANSQHLLSDKGLHLFANERSPLFWANLTTSDFINVNQGGTSSGKTEAIIRVMITLCIFAKVDPTEGFKATVVSSTVRKLIEDSLSIALRVIAQPEIAQFVTQYHATNRVITFSNGATLSFKSYSSLEEAKGEKHHVLYINEATRIAWLMFYELYLRTKLRIFIDYNPTAEFWAHDRLIVDKVQFPSIKLLRSWHIHNPYLSEADRAKIERISDEDMWKVYARGLTGKLRGVIYKSWVEVDAEFNYTDGVIWATDWGFSEKKTADPTAGVRIMSAPPDRPDLDFIVDEVCYNQGLAPGVLAQTMKAFGYKDGQYNYCDHSVEANYELILNGINGTINAVKGPGSIITGILYLRRMRIGYTKRSLNIKRELDRYKWMEIDGIQTNTPEDQHNHLMDAIRYGIHSNALHLGIVA